MASCMALSFSMEVSVDLFGDSHRGYNSSDYMSDRDINELGNNSHT